MDLKNYIRDVPDFPKPGIVFKDITPLLKNSRAFKKTIDLLEEKVRPLKPDQILGIESRGFVFAGALAVRLGTGVLIARKPGKLPYKTDSVSYDLEYGSATLQLHQDAVKPGQRILIVDDLLATGGTAQACARLVEGQRGVVCGIAFVIELSFLSGRARLQDYQLVNLISY
jgi:adenine phosphoribosyltransferase